MSKRAPNSARGYDCNSPNEYAAGVKICSGEPLPVMKVWQAVEMALRNGTRPEERTWSLWGWDATEADTRHIYSVLAAHRLAWLPWARLECDPLPDWYWGEKE